MRHYVYRMLPHTLALLPVLLPIVLFGCLYSIICAFWLREVGAGAWLPAWPVARTRFVLLMVTVPVWAAFMMAYTVVPRLIRHCSSTGGRYRDYELAPVFRGRQEPRTLSRMCFRKQMSWWTIRLLIYFFLFAFGVYLVCSYEQPNDIRFRPLLTRAVSSPRPEGFGNGGKIFVAAMFHNNEKIIPYWTKQVARVLRYIGTDNVFVSIIESYSNDATPALLLDFDKTLEKMGIARRIIVGDTSVSKEKQRIRFLAALRNRVLEPLVERGGFDIVLFLNDILVSAESILELLRTRDGNWDMICGLDLSFWGLYDAWVIRDQFGKLVSSAWPYFLEESGRKSLMADEPVPVFTCWNGITAFRAEPLLPIELRTSGRLATTTFSKQLPSTHPAYPRPETMTPATTPPLEFRVSDMKECYSSESFLLPYDLRRQFNMSEIYINPRVIVSYGWNHYIWYKYITRHWLVKWWMETWERGKDLKAARMIIGEAQNIWEWDGGECQPWH
ncbi:hypothetical protein AX15_003217 [Amanita polypyramis BW_CC]|nr:hypothetical protein AX15_003217 [Amanita polypyramis BW_CC]